MGTHPIFESDFDCLTAIMGGLCLYSQYSGCICGTVKSADYVIASFNEVKCSAEYAAKPSVGNCSPSKCGRMVLDDLFSQAELEILVKLAEQGTMASGGGAGPASILELASSTNSRGSQFVSLFAIREQVWDSSILRCFMEHYFIFQKIVKVHHILEFN